MDLTSVHVFLSHYIGNNMFNLQIVNIVVMWHMQQDKSTSSFAIGQYSRQSDPKKMWGNND